jgi:outer membrane receptor protein involved in Fe transport
VGAEPEPRGRRAQRATAAAARPLLGRGGNGLLAVLLAALAASAALALPARADDEVRLAQPRAQQPETPAPPSPRGQVVTASGGRPEERTQAAGTVLVIDREAIARRGLRSVAEALADVPGLYVVEDHVQPALSVRGMSAGLRAGTRLVKVLINGAEVAFRPDATAFIGPAYLPMESVERIEVVLGPLSALYGANAFGATVNVITRTPDRTAGALALHADRVESNLGGGVSGFAAAARAGLGASLAFSLEQTDRSGLAPLQTFAGQGADPARYGPLLSGRSRQDTQKPLSLFVRGWAGQPASDRGQLVLQGGFQRLDQGAEFQDHAAMTGQSRVALDNLWSHARYQRHFSDDLQLALDAGFSTGHPTDRHRLYLAGDDSGYLQPRYGYRALTLAAALLYRPRGDQLDVRAAVEGELDREEVLHYRQTFLRVVGQRQPGDTVDLIAAGEARSHLVSTLGAALQLRSRPLPDDLPGLSLSANLRADRLRYGAASIPVQPSWRVGTVYRVGERVTAKLVAGRAFQAPSPVLVFAKSGQGLGNSVVGSADLEALDLARPLRPQALTGTEVAVSLRPGADSPSFLDLSLFHQVLDDAITFIPAGADFVAQNGGQVRSAGVGARGETRQGRLLAAITLSATTLLEGWRPQPTTPSAFPRYQAAAELGLDLPEAFLHLGAHLRWISARGASASNILLNNLTRYDLPAYTRLDLTLRSSDLPWPTPHSRMRLLLGVHNALDTRYAEPGTAGLDIPSLGRRYILMLQHDL